jgi:hypothetical protein
MTALRCVWTIYTDPPWTFSCFFFRLPRLFEVRDSRSNNELINSSAFIPLEAELQIWLDVINEVGNRSCQRCYLGLEMLNRHEHNIYAPLLAAFAPTVAPGPHYLSWVERRYQLRTNMDCSWPTSNTACEHICSWGGDWRAACFRY